VGVGRTSRVLLQRLLSTADLDGRPIHQAAQSGDGGAISAFFWPYSPSKAASPSWAADFFCPRRVVGRSQPPARADRNILAMVLDRAPSGALANGGLARPP
jgi:hypothetical protein